MGLGDRLREERTRLKLDQLEFGALGGVSKNTQLNYEKELRKPDSEYLQRLDAAGVDVLYVLTGARKPQPTGLTPQEGKMLDNYRALAEEDKNAVTRLTDSLAKPCTAGSGKSRAG